MATGLAADPRSTSGRAVVVCGAGAAGMAAAIATARAGKRVLLVEREADLGGTMAGSLLHTLAGLYDSTGAELNDGLPAELASRLLRAASHVRKRRMGRLTVLHVDPNLYREAVRAWIAAEPGITPLYSTRVSEVSRVGAVVSEVALTGPDGPSRIPVEALVDATGDGTVVAAIDETLVEREGYAAGGWIFRLRGASPEALVPPRPSGLSRAIAAEVAAGRLPPGCARAWIDGGVHPDELFVKLFVPLPPDWRARHDAIVEGARAAQESVAAFLRALPGLGATRVAETGRLGFRDGGRVRGRFRLTGADVRAQRRFSDAACRCAWPIELWEPDGRVTLDYLPDGGSYDIPLGCLQVASLENVWTAGKSLSADREAQASARCVGTCWAMGEAVGRALGAGAS